MSKFKYVTIPPNTKKVLWTSHNFCDKTSWWYNAIKVTGETLTNSGDNTTYTFANQFIIDADKISDRRQMISKGLYDLYYEDTNGKIHFLKIYVNGTQQDNNFTINYRTGTITFTSSLNPSDIVTADYYYATDSTFKIIPDTGKVLKIWRIEGQFSKNLVMNDSMRVKIKLYNGAYTAFDKDYINEMDWINETNLGYSIPAFGALTTDTIILPLDYPSVTEIKSSLQMSFEMSLTNHNELGGNFGTISIYMFEEDE